MVHGADHAFWTGIDIPKRASNTNPVPIQILAVLHRDIGVLVTFGRGWAIEFGFMNHNGFPGV